MASEAGFEVIDIESGTIGSKVTDEKLRNIDHKHSQISRIVEQDAVDVHKIFETSKLFGVAEVEFDLEAEAVIVDEFIERQTQIATE